MNAMHEGDIIATETNRLYLCLTRQPDNDFRMARMVPYTDRSTVFARELPRVYLCNDILVNVEIDETETYNIDEFEDAVYVGSLCDTNQFDHILIEYIKWYHKSKTKNAVKVTGQPIATDKMDYLAPVAPIGTEEDDPRIMPGAYYRMGNGGLVIIVDAYHDKFVDTCPFTSTSLEASIACRTPYGRHTIDFNKRAAISIDLLTNNSYLGTIGPQSCEYMITHQDEDREIPQTGIAPLHAERIVVGAYYNMGNHVYGVVTALPEHGDTPITTCPLVLDKNGTFLVKNKCMMALINVIERYEITDCSQLGRVGILPAASITKILNDIAAYK